MFRLEELQLIKLKFPAITGDGDPIWVLIDGQDKKIQDALRQFFITVYGKGEIDVQHKQTT